MKPPYVRVSLCPGVCPWRLPLDEGLLLLIRLLLLLMTMTTTTMML